MANYKTSRTEEDILRELTALLRELKDPRIDPLLTIVRVELKQELELLLLVKLVVLVLLLVIK